jgi:hypothetical protein
MVSRTNILPDVGHISTEKSATTPWAYQKLSLADAEGPLHQDPAQGGTDRDQAVRGWSKGMEKERKPGTPPMHTTSTWGQNISKPYIAKYY